MLSLAAALIVTTSSFPHFGARHNATVEPPMPHSLRLLGRHPMEGKLEIFHQGEWGSICDDNWDMRDAEVACRQMGFGEVLDARIDHYNADWVTDAFSYGSWEYSWQNPDNNRGERIWMDNVRCSGTELRLSDCAFHGWGIENCNHYEDVVLRCKGEDPYKTVVVSITFACVSTSLSLLAVGLAVFTLWKVVTVNKRHGSWHKLDESTSTMAMQPMHEPPVQLAQEPDDRSNLL